MKVRMIKNQNGSPDGIKIKRYIKGKVYDVPEKLGEIFVENIKCAKREIIAPTEEKIVKKEIKKEEKKVEKEIKKGGSRK